MKKSSRKGLKRAAAMLSAGVLAAAMMAPAAWAADAPGSEGDTAYTGEADGTVDSNIHLIVLADDEDNPNVISVTAPTDVYLAAKTDGSDSIVDLITPTKGAAQIKNLGSNKAKVASWTVSAGEGLAFAYYNDESGEDEGFYEDGVEYADVEGGGAPGDFDVAKAGADSYWLQAYTASDQSDAIDIAVANTAPETWTMLKHSEEGVGDHLDLGFRGQIRNPTMSYYENNPVIDKVTWTFTAVA